MWGRSTFPPKDEKTSNTIESTTYNIPEGMAYTLKKSILESISLNTFVLRKEAWDEEDQTCYNTYMLLQYKTVFTMLSECLPLYLKNEKDRVISTLSRCAFHEWLGDKPCKFFYDFEKKDGNIDHFVWLETVVVGVLIKGTIDAFNVGMDPQNQRALLTLDDVIIFSACRGNHLSCHVVFDTSLFGNKTDVYNRLIWNIWFMKTSEKWKDKFKLYNIETQIDTKEFEQLRIPYSGKMDEENAFLSYYDIKNKKLDPQFNLDRFKRGILTYHNPRHRKVRFELEIPPPNSKEMNEYRSQSNSPMSDTSSYSSRSNSSDGEVFLKDEFTNMVKKSKGEKGEALKKWAGIPDFDVAKRKTPFGSQSANNTGGKHFTSSDCPVKVDDMLRYIKSYYVSFYRDGFIFDDKIISNLKFLGGRSWDDGNIVSVHVVGLPCTNIWMNKSCDHTTVLRGKGDGYYLVFNFKSGNMWSNCNGTNSGCRNTKRYVYRFMTPKKGEDLEAFYNNLDIDYD